MASHAPELIDFLEQHWWNVVAELAARDAFGQPLGNTPEEALSKLEELRQAFLNDIAEMPTEKVESIALEVLIEQDQARPFHGFGTEADYEHFGRCAYLTASEAVPLSMGKHPWIVTWETVRPYVGNSLFANAYAGRLDLIERAICWGELRPRFTPLEFLTWAHKYKLKVPDAFIESTFDRGEPIQYWHDLCAVYAGELKASQSELQATREALVSLQKAHEEEGQKTIEDWLDAQGQIDRLNGEYEAQLTSFKDALAQMEIRNAELVEQINAKTSEPVQDDVMSSTARKSLLTVAIAAAVDGFGYDPKSNYTKAPADIASAAQRLGLRMTNETVLKYLKEAAMIKGFIAPDMNRKKPKSACQMPKSV